MANNREIGVGSAVRILAIANIAILRGAAKFFSSSQPKGYPTLKLRFPRLAFGRTLNF